MIVKRFHNEKAFGFKYTDPTPQQQHYLEQTDYFRESVVRNIKRRMGKITQISSRDQSASARQRYRDNYDRAFGKGQDKQDVPTVR